MKLKIRVVNHFKKKDRCTMRVREEKIGTYQENTLSLISLSV